MKVKELIDLLLECDKDLDVVNYRYEDSTTVKEETVHNSRNGEKHCNRHVILEFSGE
jgi:hypothetical protein